MKTLNNLFGKSASVKRIDDFGFFSLTTSQMCSIKGGTEPINSGTGGTPPPPPLGSGGPI